MARKEVRIPDPGDVEEVEIVDIVVAVGQLVSAGEPLMEIATDKANMDVEAPSDGTVTEILVSEGAIVAVDTPLLVLEA